MNRNIHSSDDRKESSDGLLRNTEEAVSYILSMPYTGGTNGLAAVRKLLSVLSNPQNDLNFVHIAGTNGKGSTAAMLAAVLCAAGYTTGLYTSPYITSFSERIQINHQPIEDEALVRITNRIKQSICSDEIKPVSFDLITAVAMEYFKEKRCDIVVLETGLGGTFDATNVISNAEVVVLTAIGYDHCKILGSRMEEIAQAKAGIIKENNAVVFYGENETALSVIQTQCDKTKSHLTVPDFTKIRVFEDTSERQRFCYGDFGELTLPLIGAYQRKNAAVVLETLRLLQKKGYQIMNTHIQKGLSGVKWPARFEIVHDKPTVVLDGSHNPQGMKETACMLQQYFSGSTIRAVYGVMADKDVQEISTMLCLVTDEIYVGDWEYPRAMKAEALEKCLLEITDKMRSANSQRKIPAIVKTATQEEALCVALKCSKKEDVIYIGGSLYLAGAFRKRLIDSDYFFSTSGEKACMAEVPKVL